MNNLKLGFALILISTFAFSAGNIGVKFLGGAVSPWQLVSIRGLWGVAVALIWARFDFRLLATPAAGLLVALGVASTVSITCLVSAFQRLPVSVVMPLFYLYPALGALLSPVINREKPRPLDWLAIACAFAGAFVLAHGATTVSGHSPGGVAFALTAALGLGFFTNLARKHRLSGQPPKVMMFYTYLVNFLICFPLAWFTAKGGTLLPDGRILFHLNTWILPCMILGLIFMYTAYRYLSAFQGGVVQAFEMAIVVVYGLVFLHEPLTSRLAVGLFFSVSSVALIFAGRKLGGRR